MAGDKAALLAQVVSLDLPSTEARDDERPAIRVCVADDRETTFRGREHSAFHEQNHVFLMKK